MEQHGAITSLEFFGQSHLLSGSADNSICIWRTSDWNCLHILGGHKYVRWSTLTLCVAASTDALA